MSADILSATTALEVQEAAQVHEWEHSLIDSGADNRGRYRAEYAVKIPSPDKASRLLYAVLVTHYLGSSLRFPLPSGSGQDADTLSEQMAEFNNRALLVRSPKGVEWFLKVPTGTLLSYEENNIGGRGTLSEAVLNIDNGPLGDTQQIRQMDQSEIVAEITRYTGARHAMEIADQISNTYHFEVQPYPLSLPDLQ